jgi:D-alanine-D-alanine ligase-like ATP-grasp enzyme
MSDASLIPQMAEHDGIALKEMLSEVIEVALID